MLQKIGGYTIQRRLGSGGMGVVYEAKHEQSDRHAAIKVLHREFAQNTEIYERFLNEARAVNLVQHPNVVSIYEFGKAEDGSPYIVMEYLQGETLRDRMRKAGKRLAPAVVMNLGRHIASGLAAAHAKHIVHRDLKPTNILIVPDADATDGERVKVVDFGVAKLLDHEGASITGTGISMGTPTYMAPEQCRSARDATDRSDVYALGVILYEALAGELPFREGEGPMALMTAHIKQDPPPLANRAPNASAELCALVHRMLAKQPGARPSAAEVADSLARLSGIHSPAALPTMPPSPAPPPPNRSLPGPEKESRIELMAASRFTEVEAATGGPGRLIALLAGAALLLGIIGLFTALRYARQEPRSVRWQVSSEPPGADVLDDSGHTLGRTPLLHALPRGVGRVLLTLRMDGFGESQVLLSRERDDGATIKLIQLPAAEPKVVQPAVATSPPKKERSPQKGANKHRNKRRPNKR